MEPTFSIPQKSMTPVQSPKRNRHGRRGLYLAPAVHHVRHRVRQDIRVRIARRSRRRGGAGIACQEKGVQQIVSDDGKRTRERVGTGAYLKLFYPHRASTTERAGYSYSSNSMYKEKSWKTFDARVVQLFEWRDSTNNLAYRVWDAGVPSVPSTQLWDNHYLCRVCCSVAVLSFAPAFRRSPTG